MLDAGHEVRLVDAEFGPMSVEGIVEAVGEIGPDAVLLGHSGSTSGHPSAMRVVRAVRARWPGMRVVYGGVFPTYHWREVLSAEPAVDVIVRGEGEETVRQLVGAWERGEEVAGVRGVATRREGTGVPYATLPAPLIRDLDAYRVGWELIDPARYSYWGDRRAVVVQFSRGCPHPCSYCGQRGFWTRWRHRDPVRFARELAWLHREHGVEVINFADENPTASRSAWKAMLEALVEERVPLVLVGSTRAGDIVRDADLLPLYRRAGVARFLMGMESTDEGTLARIRKGSTTAVDREAIRLLREHGILSMAAMVAGFDQETDGDFWRLLRQVLAYDPDQIQALYATPHRWTSFYREEAGRRVIQTDLGRWDYKHQVLATGGMPAWRTFAWMKFIEVVVQMRPRALRRYLAHPDPGLRAAMRWYYRIGRRVWPYEVWQFMFRDGRTADGPTLEEFLGSPQEGEAEPMARLGGREDARMLADVVG